MNTDMVKTGPIHHEDAKLWVMAFDVPGVRRPCAPVRSEDAMQASNFLAHSTR